MEEAKAVRDEIVKANMRLVISIAKKFVSPQHSFDELLSEGIMTLIAAVEKFDYDPEENALQNRSHYKWDSMMYKNRNGYMPPPHRKIFLILFDWV